MGLATEPESRWSRGGQALAQPGADLGLVDAGALDGHGAEHDGLAEGRVLDAHGNAHFDGGVLGQGLLDLDGRDVGAAGLDDVREPAGPVEVAVGVDGAAVLGAEEAVLVDRALGQRYGSGGSGASFLPLSWSIAPLIFLNIDRAPPTDCDSNIRRSDVASKAA